MIGSGVHTEYERYPADRRWSRRLLESIPGSVHAEIAGVDAPIAQSSEKVRLHARTGAKAVDMESHIAARLAAAHGLAFAALRIVCDPADRAIPPAAIAGMREDGSTDLGAILQALLGAPGQLPAMIRLACEARAAFGALDRCRHSLGVGLQPL